MLVMQPWTRIRGKKTKQGKFPCGLAGYLVVLVSSAMLFVFIKVLCGGGRCRGRVEQQVQFCVDE